MVEENGWDRSSFCNPCCSNCVEVRRSGDGIEVRDSKDPGGGTLLFTQEEWVAFVAGVKAGEFGG